MNILKLVSTVPDTGTIDILPTLKLVDGLIINNEYFALLTELLRQRIGSS
jgi:hypothetical protein